MAEVPIILDTVDKVTAAQAWSFDDILAYLKGAVNGLKKGAKKDKLLELFQAVEYIYKQRDTKFVAAELLDYNYTGPSGSRKFRVLEFCTLLGFLITDTLGCPIKVTNEATAKPGDPIMQQPRAYCHALLTMYAEWCDQFCQSVVRDTYSVTTPKVVCIQYLVKNGQLTHIFLGSSWAGLEPLTLTAEQDYGDSSRNAQMIKTRCKTCRKESLQSVCSFNLETKKAPRTTNLKEGHPNWVTWGDCAETFTYQLLASTPSADKPLVYCKAMFTTTKQLKDACENCVFIINDLGGTIDNFNMNAWGEGIQVKDKNNKPMTVPLPPPPPRYIPGSELEEDQTLPKNPTRK